MFEKSVFSYIDFLIIKLQLIMEGVSSMSNDKIELLNIIRQSDNPEQTVLKLFEMITSLLEPEPSL